MRESFFVAGAVIAAVAACSSTDGAEVADPPATTVEAGPDADASEPDAAAPAETCEAKLPTNRTCYSGPPDSRGKGRCKDGTLTCAAAAQTPTCDGEVLPAIEETCNDLDDDCDGVVDEGFDKQTSPAHCGTCNHACAANEWCNAGTCEVRKENCSNGIDDDLDGMVDCADPSCLAESCGVGCTCGASGKVETNCSDGLDNDGANGTDCADPACSLKSCGTGCVCANGVKKETICNDGLDNDGNGKKDCADSSCIGAACGAGKTCQANGTCQ